jgi:Bifunctional DNA primase/polymerase, N-terminal
MSADGGGQSPQATQHLVEETWCSLWPEPGAPVSPEEHARELAAIAANVANARIGRVVALRTRLWDNKYRPIAVKTAIKDDPRSGKAPFGDGWPERARRNPPAAVVEPFDSRAANTGILADGLQVVDGDIDQAELAGQIRDLARSLLGATIRRARSTSSRFALIYRAAVGEPAKRVVSSADGRGQIEILGRRQQLVAFGQHYSGAQLCWPDGGPDTTPVDQLPAVSEDQVTAFLAEASPLLGAAPPEALRAANAEAPLRAVGHLSPYCEAALDGAVKAILTAPAGKQHKTLNREVFSIATLVEGEKMPASLALQALRWAASQMSSHKPHDLWTQRELEKKVTAAFQDGLRHPRGRRHG